MTIEEKVQKLDEHVRSLEATRAVVIAVGVIFGVSGAWGYNILQGAKTQLDGLANPTGQFNAAKERAVAEFREEASQEKDKQVTAFKQEVHARRIDAPDSNGECEIFTDMQVCWGSEKPITTAPNFTFIGNATFANAFEAPPEILFSTVGQALNYDVGYALFAGSATTTGAHFEGIETTHGRGAGGLTTPVTYMAIGKPPR